MNATQSSGGEATAIIPLCLFLIILFVTRRALAESSFQPCSRFALAVCVSALAMIGLMDTFGGGRGGFQPLLVPYEAMAVSIILSPLVLAVALFLRFLGFGRKSARRRMIERPPQHRAAPAPHLLSDNDNREPAGRRATAHGVAAPSPPFPSPARRAPASIERPLIQARDRMLPPRARSSAWLAEGEPRRDRATTKQGGPLAEAADIKRKGAGQ